MYQTTVLAVSLSNIISNVFCKLLGMRGLSTYDYIVAGRTEGKKKQEKTNNSVCFQFNNSFLKALLSCGFVCLTESGRTRQQSNADL